VAGRVKDREIKERVGNILIVILNRITHMKAVIVARLINKDQREVMVNKQKLLLMSKIGEEEP